MHTQKKPDRVLKGSNKAKNLKGKKQNVLQNESYLWPPPQKTFQIQNKIDRLEPRQTLRTWI